MNEKTKIFISRSKSVHGQKYDYSKSSVINFRSKVIIGCLIHGDFTQRQDHHINGHGCYWCGLIKISDKLRHQKKEFIVKAVKTHNNRYTYSSVVYINRHTKVDLLCQVHGIFQQTPNNHIYGKGCPKCNTNTSKGEIKIRKYLLMNNMDFVEQYKFPDCKLQLPLAFDFFLPEYNMLIEYDGEQHYKRRRNEFNLDNLQLRQVRDSIKNKYAKKKDIKLLRIPYWEFNKISLILDKHLLVS